jgi:PTS system fructose-specific IIA component/PTS system nitrogen regulatory IIA component
MEYAKLFTVKHVVRGLAENDKETVLRAIVEQLRERKLLPDDAAKEAIAAILKREELGSTGIGNAVAIPHAKIKKLDKMVAAVAVADTGIDFGAIDGEDVHLVFMILSPADRSDEHLAVLRWLSTLVRNSDFCRFARASKTAKEMVSLIEEMSAGVK